MLLPTILAALQLGSQYFKGRKESQYQKEMEKAQEEADRKAERAQKRAALSRAIGYNDPTFTRRTKTPKAPDLSNYDLVGGLAGLGSTYASQNLGGPGKVGVEAGDGLEGIDYYEPKEPYAYRNRYGRGTGYG